MKLNIKTCGVWLCVASPVTEPRRATANMWSDLHAGVFLQAADGPATKTLKWGGCQRHGFPLTLVSFLPGIDLSLFFP